MPAPKGNQYGKATQFKPGESGNPNGRPKGKTLTERVRDVLEANPERAAAIVEAGIQAAEGGDFQFWKYLCDRMEGMPTQMVSANVDAMIRVRFADEDSVKQAQLYGTESVEQEPDA